MCYFNIIFSYDQQKLHMYISSIHELGYRYALIYWHVCLIVGNNLIAYQTKLFSTRFSIIRRYRWVCIYILCTGYVCIYAFAIILKGIEIIMTTMWAAFVIGIVYLQFHTGNLKHCMELINCWRTQFLKHSYFKLNWNYSKPHRLADYLGLLSWTEGGLNIWFSELQFTRKKVYLTALKLKILN